MMDPSANRTKILNHLKSLLPHNLKASRSEGPGDLMSNTSTISKQETDAALRNDYSRAEGNSNGYETLDSESDFCAADANWMYVDYRDGSKYIGWLSGSERNGHGIMTNRDSTYEGQWKSDLPNGNGRLSIGEGTVYEGAWDSGLPDGHGTAKLPDGSSYVGRWKHGYCDGHGKLISQDGRIYVGAFSGGLPNGEGMLITPAGIKCKCAFTQGVPFGIGQIEWPSGHKYTGAIAEGVPHGLGRLQDESRVTLGIWNAGKLETRLNAHDPIPDSIKNDPALSYIANN